MVNLTKDNIIEMLEKQNKPLSEVLEPEDFAEPGKLADQLAREFIEDRDNLKPTQLRKIFHALKDIERPLKGKEKDKDLSPEARNKIILLVPELAYATGRELIPKKFYRLMRILLSSEKLKTGNDLERVVQFLTAILAYHKYHEKVKGGRE